MCRINHVNYDHDVFIYPDEVCTMERLSEHVFVATWELKARVSASCGHSPTKEKRYIMEFIKYFTNPQFDNVKFADMLRLKMNVRAKAVEDGVILDRDAFNAMSAALRERGAPNLRTKEGSIIMTYNEFLSRFCGCHEDEVGNRPCDNGCMCDKCMTPELEKLWKEVRDNA